MADAQPNPVQPAPKVVANKIRVIVRNRQSTLFDDDAKSVTSCNDTGTFDVLAEHSNFISLINKSVTIHKIDGQEQTFQLENGVIKVRGNTVHCYINLLAPGK